MVRPVVDLPQPDSPTRPRVSPCLTVKLTPSTALTSATLRWSKIPCVMGKYFFRSRTSSRTSLLSEDILAADFVFSVVPDWVCISMLMNVAPEDQRVEIGDGGE